MQGKLHRVDHGLAEPRAKCDAYMKEVLPLLDAEPGLFRYSWFATRNAPSPTRFDAASNMLPALNGSTSMELTSTGQLYRPRPPRASLPSKSDDRTEALLGPSRGARGPKSYRELLRTTWPLLACTMVLGLHKEVDIQLFTPFFYSRVRCCGDDDPPLPNSVGFGDHAIELSISADSCQCNVSTSYPTAASSLSQRPLVIDACDVPMLPKQDPLWSHSSQCANYPYVQMTGQLVYTTWQMVAAAAAILFLPISGRAGDMYGRRAIFIIVVGAAASSFWIFTLDGVLGFGDLPIYATGIGIGAFSCLLPVQWAMAVDLVPEPADQARFFPIMSAVANGSIASIVGEGVAYLCLGLYLDDYTIVWAVLSILTVGVMVFLILFVPETLASPKAWGGWRQLANDILPCGRGDGAADSQSGCLHGATLWCKGSRGGDCDSSGEAHRTRRRILLITLIVQTVGAFFAMDTNSGGPGQIANAFQLGPLHMQQEDLVVVQAVGKVATILSTPAAMVLLPMLGPHKSIVLGALGGIVGPLSFALLGSAGPYLSTAVSAIATALNGSAFQMYVAAALHAEDRTKAQSSLQLFKIVAQNLGKAAYTALFFGSRELMTEGYEVAAVVGVPLLVLTVAYPRTLPAPPSDAREEAEVGEEAKPGVESAAPWGGEEKVQGGGFTVGDPFAADAP